MMPILKWALYILLGGAGAFLGLSFLFLAYVYLEDWRFQVSYRKNTRKYRCPHCLCYLHPDGGLPIKWFVHFDFYRPSDPELVAIDMCPEYKTLMRLDGFHKVKGFILRKD
jgi:hypothetical protein